MEMDEAFNPIEVSLLGTECICLTEFCRGRGVAGRSIVAGLGSTIGPLPDDFGGFFMATR
jgi:hypothetical protein